MESRSLSQILSHDNTDAIRGVLALGIVVFHVILSQNVSPIFNLWGGLCVAIFLILSGYGINESYKKNGLEGYWQKKYNKIILPLFIFVCSYNFVWQEGSLQNCIEELLYIKPTFWFVFHLLKCYFFYWVVVRFVRDEWRSLVFVIGAFICLNTMPHGLNLEPEQSFSFLTGVFLSKYKKETESLIEKRWSSVAISFFCVGIVFAVLRMYPPIYELKGTIIYSYLLMPFRLSWGLSFLLFFAVLNLWRVSILKILGKWSFEIYIAHIPFYYVLCDEGINIFLVYSLMAMAFFVVYRRYFAKVLNVATIAFLAVNALFVAKYSARAVPDYYIPITLLYMCGLLAFIVYVLPWLNKSKRIQKWTVITGIIAFVMMLCLQYYFDPFSIRVDRWSALYFPIQNMLNGKYPYLAQTHLGGYGSPFPVWQLFHVPFYLLGNVGLSFFVCLAIFYFVVFQMYGRHVITAVIPLMIISISIWYEAVVRSDYLSNMILCAVFVLWIGKHLNKEWIDRHSIIIVIITALFASTRLLTIIPIALLLFPYYINMRLKKQICLAAVFLLVFIITFIPFALWDWNAFFYFKYNPWTLQTRQGSPIDFIIFIPLFIILAKNWKGSMKLYCRNVIIMLAVFLSVSLLHRVYDTGNWDLFSSDYDITYFNALLPFAVLCISLECKVEEKTILKEN